MVDFMEFVTWGEDRGTMGGTGSKAEWEDPFACTHSNLDVQAPVRCDGTCSGALDALGPQVFGERALLVTIKLIRYRLFFQTFA